MHRSYLWLVLGVVLVLLTGDARGWGFGWGGTPSPQTGARVYGPTQRADQQWTYKDAGNWPAECAQGSRQSPIAFNNADPGEVVQLASLTRLRFSPKCDMAGNATDMEVLNEMNTIIVKLRSQTRLPDEPSECTIADPLDASREYHFDSITFHVPPEHWFRSFQPEVEMQLHFRAGQDRRDAGSPFLSIAVFLKSDSHINTTSMRHLQHMFVDGRLPPPRAMTTCTLTTDLDLATLLPPRQNYLLYNGSLTTPPCTEGVRWVVMTSPIFISPLALSRLQEALSVAMKNDFDRYGNARPPQPLNDRRIFRFIDKDSVAWRRADGIARDAWRKHDAMRAVADPHNVLDTASDDVDAAQDEFVVVDVYDNSSYRERVARGDVGANVSASVTDTQARRDQSRAAANTAHVERSDHTQSNHAEQKKTNEPKERQGAAKHTRPTRRPTTEAKRKRRAEKTDRHERGIVAWFARTARGLRRGVANVWHHVVQHPLRALLLLLVAFSLVCIAVLAWHAWYSTAPAGLDTEPLRPRSARDPRDGRYGTNPV